MFATIELQTGCGRPVLPSASSEALGQVPGGSGLGVNAEDHGSWPMGWVEILVSVEFTYIPKNVFFLREEVLIYDAPSLPRKDSPRTSSAGTLDETLYTTLSTPDRGKFLVETAIFAW